MLLPLCRQIGLKLLPMHGISVVRLVVRLRVKLRRCGSIAVALCMMSPKNCAGKSFITVTVVGLGGAGAMSVPPVTYPPKPMLRLGAVNQIAG